MTFDIGLSITDVSRSGAECTIPELNFIPENAIPKRLKSPDSRISQH